ncbi:MAG: hypothetical protein NT113_08235 [Hyphomicrobiales bacterium]|nr:hypothetical protein [Hyphomicrobiales bacterium]
MTIAQAELLDALTKGNVAARAELREDRAFRKYFISPTVFTVSGVKVDRVGNIPPEMQQENWALEPWILSDGKVDWSSSSICATILTGYGSLGFGESKAVKTFRQTIATGIQIFGAHLYRHWPDGRHSPEEPAVLPLRPRRRGRTKGTGVYFIPDTAILSEVIAMIKAKEALTSDGAVNEILRRDSSRLIGKSDLAMKRRIRDRYKNYLETGALN